MTGSKRVQSWLWVSIILLVVSAIFIGIKDYSYGSYVSQELVNTKINNYLIFSESYSILHEGGNLYEPHPNRYYDLYKYSPAFALFFTPIAFMPGWLGLVIWNLINLIALILGLWILPHFNPKKILIVLLIVVMELLGSIMNEQSNGLMAGLIVLGLGLFERKQTFWAIGLLVFSAFIKIFSLIFLILILFFPRIQRNIGYGAFWLVSLAIIPLLVVSPEQLIFLYKSWFELLSEDHSASYGFSAMGILNSWFGFEPNKTGLALTGLILSLVPLIKRNLFQLSVFRYLFTSVLLIYVVIFNHKAESPTFVIAMTGIGIYYVSVLPKKIDVILLIFSILFVSIAFSDLTPSFVKEEIFVPYSLKALPCLVIWGYLLWYLMSMNEEELKRKSTIT